MSQLFASGGRRIEASRGNKLWHGEYMGKLMEDKGYFSKVYLYRLFLMLAFCLLCCHKTPLEKGFIVTSFL